MKISVIGGGGRVGFPMCLVLADAGHEVVGIDTNVSLNKAIMEGKVPYREENAEDYLQRALSEGKLKMTDEYDEIKISDVIIIVIGTPIDEHLNPDLTGVCNLFRKIDPYFKKEQLIILRSTVAPGTTDRVKSILEEETGFKVGEEIYLAFAPERVLEGKAIAEIQQLPQHIGVYDDKSYKKAEDFFKTFLKSQCIKLTAVEAELAKLMTNMARYVNFALANEYHLIADSFGVNAKKIIDACNMDYPRMNLPTPGPNVGGPCLHKDGWFLLERIPYNELIASSFRINEGMPAHIIRKIESYSNINKIAVLGMSFKANSDDTRNSVSFKLKKQLEARNYELVLVEPNLEGYSSLSDIKDCDAVILMSPHDEFKDLGKIISMVNNPECLYVDIWGVWEEMKYSSDNGFFKGKEV